MSVASENILFSHAGADARVKINKNTTGDTASLLYQSGFSGRAESGLSGDDDFHFKVSPDGSAWNESFIINKTSGLITIENTMLLDPQSSDPVSPGNGQLWYNSTTQKFRARQNGASLDLISAGGGGGGPSLGLILARDLFMA